MDRLERPSAIVCLSRDAIDLATSIKGILQQAGRSVQLHGKQDVAGSDRSFLDTRAHIASLFASGTDVIALCASGIVIRSLAPLLSDKFEEPAVISVSRDGASVIPLLGGHHGANDLARLIAAGLDGHAAVTTAGDCRFRTALDHPPRGWRIQNGKSAGPLMDRMVKGEAVQMDENLDWIDGANFLISDEAKLSLGCSIEKSDDDVRNSITYSPQKLVLGVGCERGVSAEHLIAHVETVLSDHNLAPEAVGLVTSIDLKMDEAAIHALAHHFKVPARFFSAEMLNEQMHRLANPSDIVFKEVGCYGVAEGSALAAVGESGDLLVAKVKSDKTTCAIGLAASSSQGRPSRPQARSIVRDRHWPGAIGLAHTGGDQPHLQKLKSLSATGFISIFWGHLPMAKRGRISRSVERKIGAATPLSKPEMARMLR